MIVYHVKKGSVPCWLFPIGCSLLAIPVVIKNRQDLAEALLKHRSLYSFKKNNFKENRTYTCVEELNMLFGSPALRQNIKVYQEVEMIDDFVGEHKYRMAQRCWLKDFLEEAHKYFQVPDFMVL